MSNPLVTLDPWQTLRRYTPARIGMGRVGTSLPTKALLEFGMDHAHARSVISAPLEIGHLARELERSGFHTIHARSRSKDREEYLHRPDLGRRLDPACVEGLRPQSSAVRRLTVVVADGLSSLAPMQHALPLLLILRQQLPEWDLDDIVLATQARVALGDEIGELRGAEAVVVLIGERPGLNAADSLGAYLTYRPCIGRTDAERNCISNIRPTGLTFEQAAHKLAYLLRKARLLGSTGIHLKDDSDDAAQAIAGHAGTLLMKEDLGDMPMPHT
ncbi:ethanolamine ammonia-lyase subunit EutC [Edaphobacter sp.]|uniref:ethanolamine ammonia-lyase subunit EutC n=1 Tax=Edaphobacter sp. TaxID=1934404 RepID=UPI002DB8BEBA|nr:ethanolamine ammonia-lyase subunit EutC [Edaphobacter sp.]HEU5340903.1 ethanolamine ammonia-lyase subunit EutC [Edaphobacter sp.]